MNKKNEDLNDVRSQKQKNHLLFLVAIVANLSQIGLCFFYELGAPFLILSYPLFYIAIFLINNKCASTWFHVITLAMSHMIFTALTHIQSSWLYLRYICDDYAGRLISALLLAIGIGITIVSGIVFAVRFYFKHKRKKKD